MSVSDTICGGCNVEFPTLAEVFSHDCPPQPGEKRRRYHPDPVERPLPTRSTTGGNMHVNLPHNPPTSIRPPSPASIGYLRTLLAEREGVVEAEAVREVLNRAREDRTLSQSLVSSCIDTLKKIPRPATSVATPGVPVVERNTGDVHVKDGRYYRIHQSQNTGGHYACKFDPDTGKFEYERGAISQCHPANKVTAEQAAEFGHMHHRCVFCSRPLDLPQSTAVGYGETCAGNHGLPWG